MPDTTYRVLLALETSGSFGAKLGELGGAAGEAHNRITALGEGARHVGETVASMGERVGGFLESIADKAIDVAEHVAKIGVVAGAAVVGYGVASLNNELEQTQI